MSPDQLPATIATAVEFRVEAKRSIFLAHLAPVGGVAQVDGVAQADAVVAAVRKSHWDARHHCTALIVGPHADRQRSSDDGEPAGTAGAPMLDVLRRGRVTDVVVVVTRWFGGTLLGAGGLVRAYGGAVTGALAATQMVDRVFLTSVTAHAPHADAGRVLAFLHQWAHDHDAVLDEPDYAAEVTLTIRVPPPFVTLLQADVAALTGGAVAAIPGQTGIVNRVRH